MAAVLVVESDPFVRHLLCIVLHALGHSVLEAEDDCRALEILEQSRDPLVALLSSRLAPVDGMQLLQAVATDRRLRAAHGFLILTREVGWLPPSFQLLRELLILRHVIEPESLAALDEAVASLAAELPNPTVTRPKRGRPMATLDGPHP
jgi:CheY-like chemotaxis protein